MLNSSPPFKNEHIHNSIGFFTNNMNRIKKEKTILLIKRLKKAYPDKVLVSLSHKTAFQLLVATILSAQCTDVVANRVTAHLFKKYKNVKGFASANLLVLEKEVYATGFYKTKAKHIIAASKKIVSCFNGRVPDSMEKLITLDGVGRKTANIILSVAFKKREGIAVDTHVKRLSNRFGLTGSSDPIVIEQDLLKIIPFRYWLEFNHILVTHGRRICRARKPLCGSCVINGFCPSRQG